MARTISANEYEQALKQLEGAGQSPELVADFWKTLADAGDVYAANAYAIIAERDDPQSIYSQIVQTHWDRVAGPEKREALFLKVGLQHAQQYAALINSGAYADGNEVRYTLPNTQQIEASYRQAVMDKGLPALTAVDSMFSVLDYNIETSSDWHYEQIRSTGALDISWARILKPELEPERIKYDSEVFLEDNIEPIKEVILTAMSLPPGSPARFLMYDLIGDAVGDVLPQMIGWEDPQAFALTAGLFAAADPSITDVKMLALLDAAFLGDEVSAGTQQRDLAWLTEELHRALHGTELSLSGNPEATYAAAAALVEELRAGGGYRFIELADLSADELAAKAKQGGAEGQAYRFALVNGHPFVLLTEGGDAPPGAQSADYARDTFTDEYWDDRAAYVATLTQFYKDDAHVKGPQTIEYHDLDSNTLVTVFSTSAGASRRIVFGSDGNDVITHGGNAVDRLYGGKGDDILEGKGGADYLEGGHGYDTYRAGAGDTLFDVDGKGRVLFGSKP